MLRSHTEMGKGCTVCGWPIPLSMLDKVAHNASIKHESWRVTAERVDTELWECCEPSEWVSECMCEWVHVCEYASEWVSVCVCVWLCVCVCVCVCVWVSEYMCVWVSELVTYLSSLDVVIPCILNERADLSSIGVEPWSTHVQETNKHYTQADKRWVWLPASEE